MNVYIKTDEFGKTSQAVHPNEFFWRLIFMPRFITYFYVLKMIEEKIKIDKIVEKHNVIVNYFYIILIFCKL